MLQKNNNLTGAEQRRGAFWLALFSIAWLQLSVAAHQFEHVAELLDDSCQVCIQLDRADDTVADHPEAASAPSFHGNLVWQSPANYLAGLQVRGFDSRAPPQL